MKKVMSIIPVIVLSLMLFTGCEEEKSSIANDTTTITPTITEDEVTSTADSSLIEQSDNSKYPYLSAIQNSLDCIFNNDEEGYLNVQHPEVRKNLQSPGNPSIINSPHEDLIRHNLNNRIYGVKEVYSFEGDTATDMIRKDEFFSEIECNESHLVTFYLDSNDSESESIRCLCLVYMVDNKWYSFFWGASIDCCDIVE